MTWTGFSGLGHSHSCNGQPYGNRHIELVRLNSKVGHLEFLSIQENPSRDEVWKSISKSIGRLSVQMRRPTHIFVCTRVKKKSALPEIGMEFIWNSLTQPTVTDRQTDIQMHGCLSK